MERPRHANTFLIVENDANDAFLIKRALQSTPRCGTSFVCRNASEAKAYLRGAGMYADRSKYPFPHVVLTDLRMEDETGIDLVEWIHHEEGPVRDLQTIILTGSASPQQFAAAEKIGAKRVYRKPTRVEDLEKLLAEIATEFCAGDDESEPRAAAIKS